MLSTMRDSIRPAARLCWALYERQRWFTALDIGGALLFVLGCMVFYAPTQYATGVTLFLVGSLLMLASVAGKAFIQHGPSR